MAEKGIQTKAIIILSCGLLAISIASIFIKLCDAPALVIATYRLVIASAFYLGFTRIKSGPIWRSFSPSQLKIIAVSGVFLTIHFATWISSLKLTSVASSVVLVQSAPIFVAIGSIIFLKEKPNAMMVVGIALAMLGSVTISIDDFSRDANSLSGNLLAICGAVGAAGYLLAGRKLRAEIDTFRYVTAVYSVTAILLLLITIFSGAPLFNYSANVYLLFFAIAIFPQIIGHTSFNWALEYFKAPTISIIMLGEPIGASILAFFILGETLTLMKILGGIVILTGVTFALMSESKVKVPMTTKVDGEMGDW